MDIKAEVERFKINVLIPIGQVFIAYWRHYKSKIITTFSSGLILAVFITDVLHSVLLKENNYNDSKITFRIFCLAIIIPILVDFTIFCVNYSRFLFYKSISELYHKLKFIKSTGNKFLYRSALIRLDQESTLLNKFLASDVKIPALQSLEYVRLIFMRILEKTLKAHDYYFTISNLDFWAQKPIVQHTIEDLIDINVKAANRGRKYIYRIVVIPREITNLNRSQLGDEEKRLQDELINLVKEMYDRNLGSDNSHLKTYFYLCSKEHYNSDAEYMADLAYTPIALMIDKNLKDIMITAPFNLDKIKTAKEKSEIPFLRMLFYSLPNKQFLNTVDYRYLEVLENVNSRIGDRSILGFDDQHKKILELDIVLNKFITKFRLLKKYEMRRDTAPMIKSIQDLYELFNRIDFEDLSPDI